MHPDDETRTDPLVPAEEDAPPVVVDDAAGEASERLPLRAPSAVVTVVRMGNPTNGDAISRVLTTIGRVDLALADELHAQVSVDDPAIRPYSVVRRAATLDVVAFRDDIAQALLRGDPEARLVTRVAASSFVREGEDALDIRLAFETPTVTRISGHDHLLPDLHSVFGSLAKRWEALGWEPVLDVAEVKRVAVWPEHLRYLTARVEDGREQRGYIGVVRYAVDRIRPQQRAALWALARFGEYRAVGRGTSHGLGRIRVLARNERWEPGQRVSVWTPASVPADPACPGDLLHLSGAAGRRGPRREGPREVRHASA